MEVVQVDGQTTDAADALIPRQPREHSVKGPVVWTQ